MVQVYQHRAPVKEGRELALKDASESRRALNNIEKSIRVIYTSDLSCVRLINALNSPFSEFEVTRAVVHIFVIVLPYICAEFYEGPILGTYASMSLCKGKPRSNFESDLYVASSSETLEIGHLLAHLPEASNSGEMLPFHCASPCFTMLVSARDFVLWSFLGPPVPRRITILCPTNLTC